MIVLRANSSKLLLALGGKTAISPCRKLLLELVNTSSSINVLQLSGVERVTFITNVDLHLGSHATSLESIAATAGNSRVLVIWMNAVFHGVFQMV